MVGECGVKVVLVGDLSELPQLVKTPEPKR